MINLIPTIGRIYPADDTAASLLTALHAYFAANTAKFTIVLTSGAGASVGFALACVADPGWQFTLRRTGTYTILFSIEPTGSITDVGDAATPPTGGSADWSGEATWTLQATTDDEVFVVVLDDAFFVMPKVGSQVFFSTSLHAGRIYKPDFEGDVALGRDGLGAFSGWPTNDNSLNPAWVGNYYTAPYSSLIHVATDFWNSPYCITNVENNPSPNPSAALMGYLAPYVVRVGMNNRTGGVATGREFGSLKYFLYSGIRDAPLSRVPSGALCFIYVNDSGGTLNSGMIPWLLTETP